MGQRECGASNRIHSLFVNFTGGGGGVEAGGRRQRKPELSSERKDCDRGGICKRDEVLRRKDGDVGSKVS